MDALALRPAADHDLRFLGEMVYQAAYWRPQPSPAVALEEALRSGALRPYLEGWGRRGDRGIIAAVGTRSIGACWYRLFREGAHGYGFVDERTPELTLAVSRAARRQGVGRALLTALLAQARLDGFATLSLSVEGDNPARVLYERCGFEPVDRRGGAWTMLVRL